MRPYCRPAGAAGIAVRFAAVCPETTQQRRAQVLERVAGARPHVPGHQRRQGIVDRARLRIDGGIGGQCRLAQRDAGRRGRDGRQRGVGRTHDGAGGIEREGALQPSG
ncbi:hypothetical protein G6F62_014888 [Rhizopus arrhizus]|nr:hypothetical protein G6F24_017721 [Rhizopus arrhizus]KAG0929971.1 hypothetical protein G6F31_017171 [Rhizopus arrhizus]KAG1309101.1 hypothetical protein G6F62_014888 [Rhizopus arrhizus]